MSVAMTEHALVVLDVTGDTKHTWTPGNEAEIAAARGTFDALKKKGYVAYQVTGSGGKGEVVRDFDPALGEIILAPPVVGG